MGAGTVGVGVPAERGSGVAVDFAALCFCSCAGEGGVGLESSAPAGACRGSLAGVLAGSAAAPAPLVRVKVVRRLARMKVRERPGTEVILTGR